MRGVPDAVDDPSLKHVEWSAVEEGFRLLERDLGKLQVQFNLLYLWSSHDEHSSSNLWRLMAPDSERS